MERAGQYGDLLFETLFFDGKEIPHLERHYARLIHGLSLLKMPKPYLNSTEFKQILIKGLEEHGNPNYPCRIRFTAMRNGKGNYLPLHPILQYELSIHRFEPKKPKNGSTWLLAPYTEQSKAPGKFSTLKSGNALLYVMAALFAEENQLDEALIVNTSGHIIESGTGNIFWKEKEQWFTPPLSDGCIAGIGRELFMESHQVQESHCSFNQLLEASCCVFTNALYPYREFKPIQLD